MFKEPELTPDLEWLLQSQEAPTPVLAEALVEAFFPSLFTTACSLIENRETAWATTVASIRDMLLAVYRYKAGANPETWARRIAMQSFLTSLTHADGQEAAYTRPQEARRSPLLARLDALPAVQRLAVGLSIIQGLAPKEIGQALGISERQAAAELDRAAVRLADGNPSLPEMLWSELSRHRPAPVIAQENLDQAVQQVLARSEAAAVRTRRANRMKESLWIVLAVLLVAVLAWGINHFLPEEAPDLQQSAPQADPPGARVQDPTRTPAMPTRLPPPTPGRAAYVPPFPQDVFYTVVVGDSWQSIAAGLGTTEDELVRLNRVPPGEQPRPGEALLIPGRLTPEPLPENTPAASRPQLAPLTVDSTLEEISEQLRSWSPGPGSLFFDAQVTFTNPPGFEGPLQRYRVQGWMSGNPHRMLILSGPLGQKPALALIGREGPYYLARPGQGQPWFTAWEGQEGELQAYPLLILMQFASGVPLYQLAGQDPAQSGEYSVSAGELLAGQETLLVEIKRSPEELAGRFWIDTQTGWPLRQEVSPAGNDFRLGYQVEMTQFTSPASVPGDLLDPWLPWRGGYAEDASGAPEASRPGPQASSLPDLILDGLSNSEIQPQDLANARLTFAGLHLYNLFEPWDKPETQPVRVFSGVQSLGIIPLPNPLFLQCTRSSDGNRIAFSSQLSLYNWNLGTGSYLHWFDLEALEVRQPASNLVASAYSFAPDGHRLAVLAPRDEGPGGIVQRNWGLFIVDTQDGQVHKLFEVNGRRPPVWNTEGTLVAVTGQDSRRGSDTIFVINAATGELDFRGLVDYNNLVGAPRLPKTWPYPDWPIDLSAEMGGLEACTAPRK